MTELELAEFCLWLEAMIQGAKESMEAFASDPDMESDTMEAYHQGRWNGFETVLEMLRKESES